LPGLLERGGRPRIWCAAAATGEEPLTLAMLLADRGWLDRVEIVASDISERALARAQRGEYAGRSLRALDAGRPGRWFDRRGEALAVSRRLVEAIDWRRVNLVDRAAVAALGAFDAIVCRNVLIYFADNTARQVVESLTAALEPQGVLMVGAAESLLRYGTSLR